MFQITLRAARISCGYTEEEAADHCKIKMDEYKQIEHDTGNIDYILLSRLVGFLGAPPDLIYFGTEAECRQHNRALNAVTKE